jgi:Na+/melibiose symporter-like transporter
VKPFRPRLLGLALAIWVCSILALGVAVALWLTDFHSYALVVVALCMLAIVMNAFVNRLAESHMGPCTPAD